MDDESALLRRWLRGDEAAIHFVESFLAAVHLWDDLWDQDSDISREHADGVFYALVVGLPANPFWREHQSVLHPVIAAAVQDWWTANVLEDGEMENDRQISYVLRCSVLSVVVTAAAIVGGAGWARKVGPEIWRYGVRQTFDEYVEELDA